ncbi:MAG: hypothetical protein AAGK22_30340 [Acidobacteriota bacterium]
MTVMYRPHDCTVASPSSDAKSLDLETWLPGFEPGDVAASPIHPVLWQR